MNVHQIDFSPGSLAIKYIQNEFASDKWSQFKTWFFDTTPQRICIIFHKNFMKLSLNDLIKMNQKFIANDVATVSINEINNLIFQNNYLGLYVKGLGEHISSLHKELDDLTILIVQTKNDLKPFEQASTSTQPDVPIQRPPEIQDFIFKTLYDLENLLDKMLS
ncbi:hypothetical protein H5410_003277 [Solanum commersonii]|uniref:Uncharacterized protein n=1 Tax=Solanum commersonii TaxID=4109 RepID=A0A9J6B4K7_SOLCO|nr:hypothetical protein H5410_003277 [Solanum commersonii]